MARGRREVWAKRVTDWKLSGLTARDFSEREGLKPNTLKWWSSRLRTATRLARPRFPPVVEVVATATTSLAAIASFEVVLADETRVVVPESFESSALRRLLDVLRER